LTRFQDVQDLQDLQKRVSAKIRNNAILLLFGKFNRFHLKDLACIEI